MMRFLWDSGIDNILIGILIGWIVFKRPEWATELFAKIKTKLFGA